MLLESDLNYSQILFNFVFFYLFLIMVTLLYTLWTPSIALPIHQEKNKIETYAHLLDKTHLQLFLYLNRNENKLSMISNENS